MLNEKPTSWASRLHCITDLTQMLSILVAQQPNQEIIITTEMVQDFGGYNLYLESSFDSPNLRLTTRRNRNL